MLVHFEECGPLIESYLRLAFLASIKAFNNCLQIPFCYCHRVAVMIMQCCKLLQAKLRDDGIRWVPTWRYLVEGGAEGATTREVTERTPLLHR